MSVTNEMLQNPAGAEELAATVKDSWEQAKIFDGTPGWRSGNKHILFQDGVAEFVTSYKTEIGMSWNAAMISRDEYGGFDLFTEVLRPYAQSSDEDTSRMIRTHYPIGHDADSTEMIEVGHVREGKFEAEGMLGGSSAPMAESYPNALEFLGSVAAGETAAAA